MIEFIITDLKKVQETRKNYWTIYKYLKKI